MVDGSRGARVIAHTAPEVELVGKVRAQRVEGQRQPVGQLESLTKVFLRPVRSELLDICANAGVNGQVHIINGPGCFHVREEVGPGNAGSRAGLLDPGDRLCQVEVGSQHRLNDGIERRVGKGPPPFQRLIGAGGAAPDKVLGDIGDRLGQGRLGRKRAGEEEAVRKKEERDDP